MEEDIKRISNLIEYIENANYVDASQCFNCEDIQAIKNILNRVKELEKIEQEHKVINGKLRERVKELEEEKKNLEHNYQVAIKETIHKSKIKEKIEEMNNIIKTDKGHKHTVIEASIVKSELEELLESGD